MIGGTGIGALIGNRYKNTLLGAILGGVGGAGIATGGKYLYNRFAKHASADVDYDAIERRAKFKALLTR